MKYKSTIEKTDNFSAVLMTNNGYPVYDIMIPSRPGYCSASGLAFYTEDEEMLKKFSKLDTEERKEYALKHSENIKTVSDIFLHSSEMRHPMPLAYNHLVYAFEETVKKGNYGCTHLIEGNKLLIFHQSSVFHKTGYKLDSKKDFNDLYTEIQNLVAKAYKEGTITPDGEIHGKALERLKAKNPEIFKEMSKHQSATLDILKSFRNELLDQCKLTYNKEESLIVNLEINNKNYKISIPKSKKELLSLNINEEEQLFPNVHELIIEIYNSVNQNKLNSFMKKLKV